MDSGIKLLVFLILGACPFFIDSYINYVLIVAYLLVATYLTRIKFSVIIKNIAAYILIIILPYTFGLLMAVGVAKITGNEMIALYNSINEVVIRLFQLFLLWYAGILYFNSTKIESVLGVFDKLLSPLKRIGVPVSDFLKVIMCVIKELKELGPEVKKSFSESASVIFGKGQSLSTGKLKAISQLLVAFIVNSFERIGKVEEYVKQVQDKDLFNYQFAISKADVLAVISIIFLVIGMIMLPY